ncbi:uncharacterized protein EV422DRAFT_546599 [Fimicolochytrium jonesii]|uniref:uncharacterized protein n=1 Tax=Fimicolochytrium jonesii TaxID=1396493 RepID=UPI0022FDF2B1|nr:uncharacterized protein EV422DRAFT_546599 [Fimicolochytrium jonesii]KAI8816228.1 hypothetical protein EV422DRAFT_546599 [Fimicolochytrium jonesii]
MTTLRTLLAFLTPRLTIPVEASYPQRQPPLPLLFKNYGPPGVAESSHLDHPINSIHFALEPPQSIQSTAADPPQPPSANDRFPKTDALFLHRPFTLQPHHIHPRTTCVLTSHEPFDYMYAGGAGSVGMASLLGLCTRQACVKLVRQRERGGRCIGFITHLRSDCTGEVEEAMGQDGETGDARGLLDTVATVFGGIDSIHNTPPGRPPPSSAQQPKIALMAALTPPLLAHTSTLGVSVYITGQIRQPAREALQRDEMRGMCVVCVGHERLERVGLRVLAGEVGVMFPGVRVSGEW